MRMNQRGLSYLRAIDDWKAGFEVAAILGGHPPANIVRSTLFALVGSGYAEHHYGNDTFRITDAGRAALVSSQDHHTAQGE